MVKTKKKWWSKGDLDKINEFITKSGREKGIEEAAAFFKVSTMSIRSRLWKSKNNINTKYITKNQKTTKIPIVRKSRAKREETIVSNLAVTSIDIKKIELDLKNNKLNIYY